MFDFLIMGAVLFLLWFGYVLRGVFTPVLIGLGLAYLFNPVITKSQMRWRVPRVVSTSVLVIVILIVVAGLIAWFGPLTVEQVQRKRLSTCRVSAHAMEFNWAIFPPRWRPSHQSFRTIR